MALLPHQKNKFLATIPKPPKNAEHTADPANALASVDLGRTREDYPSAPHSAAPRHTAPRHRPDQEGRPAPRANKFRAVTCFASRLSFFCTSFCTPENA